MAKFVEKFTLPSKQVEESMIRNRMAYNGGQFGYIDNIYPCNLFTQKELTELDFENITILYGGNGSGKTTVLNIIAEKLGLERDTLYNRSNFFEDYVTRNHPLLYSGNMLYL